MGLSSSHGPCQLPALRAKMSESEQGKEGLKQPEERVRCGGARGLTHRRLIPRLHTALLGSLKGNPGAPGREAPSL